LTFEARGQRLALRSEFVVRVDTYEPAMYDQVLDVLTLFENSGLVAFDEQGDGQRRVALVRCAASALNLLLPGTASVLETSTEELVPLPPLLRAHHPLLAELGMIDARPAVWVLDVPQLIRLRNAHFGGRTSARAAASR
jgi:hypothetical protein